MASAKILQRAETAMEIAGDFLFADEDDDDDADEGSENCSENADAEEDEGEHEADDERKSNASESTEPKGEPKDSERKENSSNSDSTKDGKKKKSEKGVAEKLKSIMGVALRPFGSKLQWKVDFNFEASNRAAKTNDRKKDSQPDSENIGRKKTTRPPKDGEKPNSTIDAGEIKRLRMENKRLEKLADKFLDAYIQLKTRIGELSEVEGQLAATRSSYDSLKAELKESQNNRESLLNKMAKQSEEHRVEVNRLNEELKKMGKDLSRMEQDKKSIEDKHKKNEDALSSIKKELENMSSVRDNLKAEVVNQEEKYRSESNRFIEDLSKAQNEKSELSTQHQNITNALKRDITAAEERRKLAEVEVLRLQHRLSELENERDTLRSNLNSSTAKVNELRRAITVLESNASTSTTVDTSNKSLFTCPLCGQEFGSLANMQLHAEDCCT